MISPRSAPPATRPQHRADAHQTDRPAGAGVLNVEGGNGPRNGVPGALQHALHVGGDRLRLVDSRLRAHHQVAQRGDLGGGQARHDLQPRLGGHGCRILPGLREPQRHLTSALTRAFQRACPLRVATPVAGYDRFSGISGRGCGRRCRRSRVPSPSATLSTLPQSHPSVQRAPHHHHHHHTRLRLCWTAMVRFRISTLSAGSPAHDR